MENAWQKLTQGSKNFVFLGEAGCGKSEIAMALAQSRPLQEASPYVQPLLYAVLGLIWIVPLLPLVKWMAKEDR